MPEIIKLGYDDLDAFIPVIRGGFETVARDFHLTRENCPTNGAFIEAEKLREEYRRGVLMYGALKGGLPAGFFALKNKGGGIFVLEKLSVLPEFRHKGIGSVLLSFAVKKAKEMGGVRISIGIIEENTVLKEWYRENGFLSVGTGIFPHLPFTVGLMEHPIWNETKEEKP